MKTSARIVFFMVITMLTTMAKGADAPQTVEVTSSAFRHGESIPHVFSNYGDNQSVDLSWNNLPAGTVELALICDDPVVGMSQPFVHWVVYNIPATAPGLPRGMSSAVSPSIPGLDGLTNGLSGVGRPGYFGPRPPFDNLAHEYHFRIYALNADLNLPEGLSKGELMEAMEGHILATGVLLGYFQRTR